jgi:hypothetical protein
VQWFGGVVDILLAIKVKAAGKLGGSISLDILCCVLCACLALNFVPTWGYRICWHVDGILEENFHPKDWCNFYIGTCTTMREQQLQWMVRHKTGLKNQWSWGKVPNMESSE